MMRIFRIPRLWQSAGFLGMLVTASSTMLFTPQVCRTEEPRVTARKPLVPLSLLHFQKIAFQHHPRIAAAHASLQAAEQASHALDALILPALVSHELHVRRQQASLGVTAASAMVDRAQSEVLYGVNRTYLTVLFAREQLAVANGVVERLKGVQELAQKRLKDGARDVTATDVNRTLVYVRLAEARKVQATQGEQRALVALREAVGKGANCLFEVAGKRLPEPKVQPNRDEVIQLALNKRADLVQANVFVDVANLEVKVQSSNGHYRLDTFAAGSDIHARVIPQANYGTDYSPGAIAPEMPTLLAGTRSYRAHRASALSQRADSVVDHTRNLITLEADDAYLRWQEATNQLVALKDAVKVADQLAADLDKDYTSGAKVKSEEVINARVLASQTKAQYNEALYKQLVALADLERITEGAFCAHLATLPIPQP